MQSVFQLPRFTIISMLLVFILSGCVAFSAERWESYAGGELCAVQPTFSNAEKQALPIFFVTTSLPDCRRQPYAMTIQRGDRIRYGRVHGSGTSEKPQPPEFLFQAHNSWQQDIADAATLSSGKIVVYIHGYNNDFADTAVQSEQIRYHTGFAGPVIGYNWPSHHKFLRYAVDEVNRVWDQPYFTAALLELAAMPQISEIVLVAHSMGARGAIAATHMIDRGHPHYAHKLRNIILASPDVDRQIFEREARDLLLTEAKVAQGRRITVFASDNDRAVAASRFLHGYDRLGVTRCIDPLATPPCYARPLRNGKPIAGLTIIDTSAVSGGFIGHMDFLDSKAGREFFCAALLSDATMMPRAYTIIEATEANAPGTCAETAMMQL
ncbi:MAG: alpha/beta hydrolase [Pseudomonadota bacterium]